MPQISPELYILGLCGIVVLVLGVLMLWGFIRWLGGSKKTPHTEEEKTELSFLERVRKEKSILENQKEDLEKEIDSTTKTRAAIIKDTDNCKVELTNIQKRLSEAKSQQSGVFFKCSACGELIVSSICPECGERQKQGKLLLVKVDWTEVYKYLYSIEQWGEPSDLQQDSSRLILPWPFTSSVKFEVGKVTYTWEKIDDEEGNDWWGSLCYEHPILGSVELINKITDGSLILRIEDRDDIELDEGFVPDDIRADYIKAAKQGLTALYLWHSSKKPLESVQI